MAEEKKDMRWEKGGPVSPQNRPAGQAKKDSRIRLEDQENKEGDPGKRIEQASRKNQGRTKEQQRKVNGPKTRKRDVRESDVRF